MLYQVMIRMRAQRRHAGHVVWEPFASPTRDPIAAMQLVRQASQRRAEALVVQAEDADDLAELVRHMRALPLPHAPVTLDPTRDTTDEPLSSSSPSSYADRLSFADELLAAWDVERWAMEQGAGGDHDTPYRFSLPTSTKELRSWLRLMVRYHHHTAPPSAES